MADETTLREFEAALSARKEGAFRLRLYVTGSTPRSTKAIQNIRTLCETHLAGRYDLEVVDLYLNPELAKDGQVIAAPTLVREEPLPARRVIGDMSDEGKVLVSLEIEPI